MRWVVCYYIYDGNEEIGSYSVTGLPIDTKILSDGEGSLPVSIELNDSYFTPLLSSQGHITGLIDVKTGECINKSPTTMFGSDLSDTPLSPWRFCGKRHEEAELGIIDFGFRHYHPQSPNGLSETPSAMLMDLTFMPTCTTILPVVLTDSGCLWMILNFSESWESFKQSCSYVANFAADYTYRSPRFTGGAQAFGGVLEAAAGGTCALASGGIGAIPGTLVMAHGLDHVFTGCRQICTGEYETPATVQMLKHAGMSHETATLVDGTISIAGTGVSGLFANSGKASTTD